MPVFFALVDTKRHAPEAGLYPRRRADPPRKPRPRLSLGVQVVQGGC